MWHTAGVPNFVTAPWCNHIIRMSDSLCTKQQWCGTQLECRILWPLHDAIWSYACLILHALSSSDVAHSCSAEFCDGSMTQSHGTLKLCMFPILAVAIPQVWNRTLTQGTKQKHWGIYLKWVRRFAEEAVVVQPAWSAQHKQTNVWQETEPKSNIYSTYMQHLSTYQLED